MSDRYVLRTVPLEQRTQWDAFVGTHPAGHFLQSWGWGELKGGSGWHPLRLALWDTQEQQIVAAAQVLRRTAGSLPPWIGHLAYIPKGPVLDWSQPAVVETLFSQLNRYLRRRNALTLRIEPAQEVGSAEANTLLKYLPSLHFSPSRAIQPIRTIMLDITPDEDTILARMKEKWRYNVRLAARKGVTIRAAQTVEDVQTWYTLLQTTGERDEFGVHTFNYYLTAWRIFCQNNQGRLLLAEHQGQLLAGIFVGLFARQGIYLYGASSNEQRNLMPNHLLQWEAMRWARQEGATCYDFWGIPDTDNEDEAMAGVYRFKAGWGGQVVRFPGCYEHIYNPLAMRLANRFVEM